MATVYVYPEYRPHALCQSIAVDQTPIMMPTGERFPQTHTLMVRLPPNMIATPKHALNEFYGTRDAVSLDMTQLRRHFWNISYITDWIEENLKGRVVVVQGTDVQCTGETWAFSFSRPQQRDLLMAWLNDRERDRPFEITIASLERWNEMAAWMLDHSHAGAIYFGGNVPGIYSVFPQRVWIEDTDTAFAFKMRFVGEPVVEDT